MVNGEQLPPSQERFISHPVPSGITRIEGISTGIREFTPGIRGFSPGIREFSPFPGLSPLSVTLEPHRHWWHEDSGFTGKPFRDISADGREESKLSLLCQGIHPSLEHSSPAAPGIGAGSSCGSLEKAKVWITSAWRGKNSKKKGTCNSRKAALGKTSPGGYTQQVVYVQELSNSTRYTPGKMGILIQRCFQQGCGGSRRGDRNTLLQ